MKDSLDLLPHNEEAYKKLIRCLNNNQLAAINHATGTGKSFIILKYLYENKDKNILYLAPTYPIIEQLLNEHTKELGIDKNIFKHLDTNIYRNLLNLDMNKLAKKYDIIVLDEYHRCGAKKWGKKINELIEAYKKEDPSKKMIGTTATEIRYLDKERNMNKILFDGVTASTLSLSDAILKGILPIFDYVTIPLNLLYDLEKIKKRCDKYLTYKEYNGKLLGEINEKITRIEEKILKAKKVEQYMDEFGKYLVFSSTINKVEDDKKIIKEILDGKNYVEFEVHSKKKKRENMEALDGFRQTSKDNNPVLYSINILNEGVHVKDVDAIFMLRETKSPIIYFQQLGRLLSYSRRKDKVTVFDFVENISKNKVVYELYGEILEKAKDLIKKDPKNKKRYEYIIKNFNIINDVSIYKDFNDLKQLANRDKLIEIRLDNAISVLEEDNPSLYIYKVQAGIDIFHYENHITKEQFNRIKKLDIDKPSIFNLSTEEFSNLLNGCLNLKEKKSLKNNGIYLKIVDFYDSSYRLPTVFSEDEEERNLAILFLKNFNCLTFNKQEKIISLCDDDLSLIEKLSYGVSMSQIDMEELYVQIDYFLEHNIYINEIIISILQNTNTKTSNEYIKKIFKSNELILNEFVKEDKIDTNNVILKKKFSVSNNILFTKEMADYIEIINLEYQNASNKLKYVESIYNELLKFINKNVRFPEYKDLEKDLFYKKIIFNNDLEKYGYKEKLNAALNDAIKNQLNMRKEKLINELLAYIENHNGLLPTPLGDANERKLLTKFNEYKVYFDDDDNKKLKEKSSEFKNYKKYIINKYTNFINRYKRRPNEKFKDEEEHQLCMEFEGIKPLLDSYELSIVDNCVNNINKYNESRQLYRKMMEERRK